MKTKLPCMLSTEDNPFNPFTEYDEWLAFDEDHGYFTNELLARCTNVSYILADSDYDDEYDKAVDAILEYNLSGKHIAVYPPKDYTFE